MKKFLLIIFGSLLVASMWASSADARHEERRSRHGQEEEYADEGHGNRGHMRGQMCFGDSDRMKKKVGLSDEQIKKIEEINLKFHKQLLEKREQIQPRNLKLRRLLLEKEIDLDDVGELLREVSGLEAEIRLDRIKHRIEIEKLLTEDQKKKMKREMRRDRKDND